ncbi:MAG TPA: hypothetical protein VMU92_14445 [Acidobacteriaceae bacterium]|nr:hypothetical protein [Acidobacteriaceae bacterium]
MNSLQQGAWRLLAPASPLANIAVPGDRIHRKCVLITGAGGSIGSALAQQALLVSEEILEPRV